LFEDVFHSNETRHVLEKPSSHVTLKSYPQLKQSHSVLGKLKFYRVRGSRICL